MFDEKLARFARGEVLPAEARELAQASLESPAWFEELTATALAKTAVSSVPVPSAPVRHAWWRSSFLLATAAAIVIGMVVLPYVLRTSQRRGEPNTVANTQAPNTGAPTPTLDFVPRSKQPILLAGNLQTALPRGAPQVFRGEEEGTRSPQQTGAIISIEGGQATISLGSADGLMKGSQVAVFRDTPLKHRVGILRVAIVFREQARVDIGESDLKIRYTVRVADSDHLQALLQQTEDFESRGDFTGARRTAAQAREWANTARVAASEKGRATEVLGRLDFKARDLAAAETHYRAALDHLLSTDAHSSPDDLTEAQNSLAALAMLRGDYDSADKLLHEIPPNSTRPNLSAERLNNLGVLAESRGDRQQAEIFYAQALALLPQNLPDERRIAKANLARVKGLH